MSESLGSPMVDYALARTGRSRHVKRYILGTYSALCDPTLRLYPDLPVDASKQGLCRRCKLMVDNGTFDEVLRQQRLGRAS